MISFYPGPSKVYEEIPGYVKEAYDEGILSLNHRSPEFMKLMEETQLVIKEKLNIPQDYTVIFTSSATECWEILAQSFPTLMSYHFYNGAFGEKWFNYTQKLKKTCVGYRFNEEAQLKIKDIDLSSEEGMICITQNETSNGTRVSNRLIGSIRKQYTNHLIAVDATSSMAGVKLQVEQADIWYASVQKCFGLPAGMGIMICSTKAVERAYSINERNHYNSLAFILDNVKKFQTPYTPNVLNIYLLNRIMQKSKSIDKVDKKIRKRQKSYVKLINELDEIDLFIKNKKVRSQTVLTIKAEKELVNSLKQKAKKAGILLGNGYGSYKETTFRIANFPALKNKEIDALTDFLSRELG